MLEFYCILILLTYATVLNSVYGQNAQITEAQSADSLSAPAAVHAAAVKLTMRDGIELSLEVFRPAQPGQYPTLLAAGPYLPTVTGQLTNYSLTGPINWLVSQGYNYVLANVRGTGGSGGNFEFMDREEQQDLYELVEWIAIQAWSDGQVAGIGAGYYGTTQWFMAIQNPPHLSCIAPVDAVLDPYRDWAWRGGIASTEFQRWYEQEIREAHAYPPPGTPPRYLQLDLRLQQLEHNMPDSWWLVRTALANLDQVKVPVLQLGSFSGTLNSWMGTLTRLDSMPVGTHTFISAAGTLLDKQRFLDQELLAYYRWCFNGKPASGPALQPPLRYQPANTDVSRSGTGWPPANINFTPLFLQVPPDTNVTNGSLMPGQNNLNRSSTQLGSTTQQDSVTFRTAPLLENLDLAGPLRLELHLSSTASDTAFSAELYEEIVQVQFPNATPPIPTFLNPDISPDMELLTANRQILVSSGVLKASRRALTSQTGSTTQTEYSYENPELLFPGRVYQLDLALDPAARQVKAGSRLVLKLQQISDASLRRSSRTDTVYHNPQYQSRLWLPLAANAKLAFAAEIETTRNNASDTGNSNFILESFLPVDNENELDGENIDDSDNQPRNTQQISAEAQLADDLFNSDNPVIELP